jgi:hypothetical protein
MQRDDAGRRRQLARNAQPDPGLADWASASFWNYVRGPGPGYNDGSSDAQARKWFDKWAKLA